MKSLILISITMFAFSSFAENGQNRLSKEKAQACANSTLPELRSSSTEEELQELLKFVKSERANLILDRDRINDEKSLALHEVNERIFKECHRRLLGH